MQKSIFSKYFRVCAVTVLSAILLLGTLFMTFAAQYFTRDKMKLLTGSAYVVKNFVIERVELGTDNLTLTDISLKPTLLALSDSSDTTIFITDINGKTLLCTEGNNCTRHQTYRLPQEALHSADEDGIYTENGRLFGYYKEPQYTVCMPIRTTGTNQTAGYLFVSADTAELHQFLNEMIKIFILCAILVLIIVFVVTYFVTMKMVRPLREMAVAAKKFGQGDFTSRIRIDSDDEIGQLAMAFNNMAKSLTGLEAMRRSFIANVSHELRTPMTSIAGFIDGILDGTIGPEKQSHYLRIVSDEVKRLSRLVRSMLNLSRIEAGELKVQTTPFNVLEVICETVFSFEQSINSKHLDIRGLDTEKIMVDADPDLIHQVVYNLIENAVKFVNEGGYLEFSFNTDNKMTYIGVRNSGEGLSKEEIPRVFDRFYKTDRSRGMDKNGVGLGLYLVRSIINLHGGDIIVKSAPGEYTEFVFSVPTAKSKNPTLVKGKEKEYPTQQGKDS
jgi:signal transduction histidine kinase